MTLQRYARHRCTRYCPYQALYITQVDTFGVVSELKTEQRAEDVNRKSVLLAQQIMYETKTDRQVRYVRQLDEEGKTFRHQREYPLQVWGWPPCSPANEK